MIRTIRTECTTFPKEPDPRKQCHHVIDLPVTSGPHDVVIGERHYKCERGALHGGIHDAFVDHTDAFPVRW